MSKLMLAFVMTVLSLASVSAQVKPATTGSQPMIGASGSLGSSRARVIGNSGPGENRTEASLTSPSSVAFASLNNSAPGNTTSGDTPLRNSTGTNATRTRLRTSAATTGTAAASSIALNQIYRVGVGDVLDVQLVDMPAAKSTLFTVLDGGMLDYPLSSAPVPVAGLTAEEIAERLSAKIKVLDNPKVVVKVRDYSSHSVIVTGLVFDPGAKSLRREATPLYVVLAEAQPRPEAVTATILRSGVPAINLELKDQNSIATLILPGDVIKVLGPPAEPTGFFYAGGR